MQRIRARLTYANLMATVAVFVALGGSSYAALSVTGKNVKNSSLTGKDVKNSSLTGKDVKNRSLLAKDFKSGQLPKGADGAAGAPGSAVAYAHVASNGTLDASRSKNVAPVSTAGALPEYYCIRPTVPVKHVVATLDFNKGEIGATFGDPFTSCPAGTVAVVQTYNSSGAGSPLAFYVAFN